MKKNLQRNSLRLNATLEPRCSTWKEIYANLLTADTVCMLFPDETNAREVLLPVINAVFETREVHSYGYRKGGP
jgi:hypothetical protein